MFKNRKIRKAIKLISLAFLLAGSLFVIGETAAAAVPPRRESVVFLNTFAIPPGWNPIAPASAWGTHWLYPNLFMYSPQREWWIPYLAEDFRWVDEFTLEVTLRPEAKWSDGVPITAHDVEFTWALGRRHRTLTHTAPWGFLVAVTAIDDRTVQFRTSKEVRNYFELIGVLDDVILPRHKWEVLEAKYGARLILDFRNDVPAQIVGGGPFRLAWWTSDIWVFERVDDWWGVDIFGLPYPRYLVHRRFVDNPSANLAVERLELDTAGLFTPAVWELWEVRGLPIRTYRYEPPFHFGGGAPIGVWMNFARPPLDNPVVRRAIAHAIPFTDLIEEAFHGYSVTAHPSMMIHILPGMEQLIDHELAEKYGYRFNPEIARSLLDQAGIIDRDGDGVREMPDGTRLGPWLFEVPFGWTDWMMMAEMITDELRKIGMDVRTEFPDFGLWLVNRNKGVFDLIMWPSGGPGLAHPWNSFRVVMDMRLTGPTGTVFAGGNFHRYMNPDVVPLLDALVRETDPERVRGYFRKLQTIAYRDVVMVPIYYGPGWYLFSTVNWVGWPQVEYPERWKRFAVGGSCYLPTFFGLVPAGKDPRFSPWETHMRPLVFSTTRIWEELAAVGAE